MLPAQMLPVQMVFLEYYNNYVQELVAICLGWGAAPLVSVQMVVFFGTCADG